MGNNRSFKIKMARPTVSSLGLWCLLLLSTWKLRSQDTFHLDNQLIVWNGFARFILLYSLWLFVDGRSQCLLRHTLGQTCFLQCLRNTTIDGCVFEVFRIFFKLAHIGIYVHTATGVTHITTSFGGHRTSGTTSTVQRRGLTFITNTSTGTTLVPSQSGPILSLSIRHFLLPSSLILLL